MTIHIGLLLFPGLTQLDLTGPFEVFSKMEGARVHLIWKTLDPVTAETGLRLLPTVTFADCPKLDVICVPGGPGQVDLMTDADTLDFLRAKAADARYVTSVCTGSLLLGAAGLLQGYKATTYWAATGLLAAYGAEFTPGRLVIDRNRITGGGVTAGIDFALAVVAELQDRRAAEMIQLGIEYNPAPPFNAGHPDVAPADVVAEVQAHMAKRINARRAQAEAQAQKA
ncbi:MAG: DJ-1/PfpI family protein [Alphaproteobacteria bacterium]|nr:MAG: DJ-1/PfpI family protein [Alphaproteobacteria bacterium]